jgi:hypothetical protein
LSSFHRKKIGKRQTERTRAGLDIALSESQSEAELFLVLLPSSPRPKPLGLVGNPEGAFQRRGMRGPEFFAISGPPRGFPKNIADDLYFSLAYFSG